MSVEFFSSAELSDVGRKRKNNEDACLRLPDRGVYCVADGMGGVAGGDLASEAITTNVLETFNKAAPEDYATLKGTVTLLRAATNKASKWIKDFADEKVIGQMGSTFVGLVFDPRNPARARALHAGDSRVYRCRDGKMEQVTTDHTAALALAAKLGRDPSSFPAKYHNELARAVGLKESVELEETKVQARSGDVFLLCCDGLYRMAPDEQIAKILGRAKQEDLGQTAKELINLANEAGGKDNITVVLIKVGDISAVADEGEPDTKEEPKPVAAPAAPVVQEAEQPLLPDEDLVPSTPDTARAEKAKPGVERKPNVILAIAAAVVVAVCVVVLVYHSKEVKKAEKQAETPPTNAAGNEVAQSNVTSPEASSTNVAVTPVPSSNAPAPNAPPVGENQTPTPTPPAAPKPGILAINSDPPKAIVWVDGKPAGNTPARLSLEAGERIVSLKYPPLADLKIHLTVNADQELQTNAAFAYGSVDLSSEPAGAEVRWKGDVLGHTPFATGPLPPGPEELQFSLANYMPSNVTVQVPADRTRATNVVTLQRGRGWLQLSVSPAEARVWLDDDVVANASAALPLDAGRPYALRAEFNQQRTNTSVTVGMGQTRRINLEFKMDSPPPVVPTPTPVTPTPPVSPPTNTSSAAGTGKVVTNDVGVLMWSNRLGMAFVKLSADKLWVQTTRVTPQQFEKVAGPNSGSDFNGTDDNQPCAVVSLQEAKTFADKLTEALKKKNELPAGCEQWHMALLDSEQWKAVGDNSDRLGMEMKKLEQSEWAVGGTGHDTEAYACSYKPNVKPAPVFFTYGLGEQLARTAHQAFRLALVE